MDSSSSHLNLLSLIPKAEKMSIKYICFNVKYEKILRSTFLLFI